MVNGIALKDLGKRGREQTVVARKTVADATALAALRTAIKAQANGDPVTITDDLGEAHTQMAVVAFDLEPAGIELPVNYPGGSGLTSGAVFGKIAGENACG